MRPTLVIVDDDLELLRALCATLEPLGDPAPFPDGESAVAFLRGSPLHLLISDLRLPDLSGIDVIAECHARHPDVPTMLLTGRAEIGDLAEAINRAGVHRFFTKPVDLDDLFLTAKNALEMLLLRREREQLHAELEKSHDAVKTLFEAERELAVAPGRTEIATAMLAHLSRAVPFLAGAVLVTPGESQRATLFVERRAPIDDASFTAFKDQIVSRHGLRASEVRLVVLGTREVSSSPEAPRGELGEALLEVGGLRLGGVQILCARSLNTAQQRLMVMLAGEAAQALRRVDLIAHTHDRQLDHLVRSLADGIVMVDDEEEVALINPAARAMLGAPSSGSIAVTYLTHVLGFHPFDPSCSTEVTALASVRREVTVGGRILHALISPVLDAHGVLSGVALVLRDLTAEKELEKRKEEFVSVVSHEMRTPLTSIAGSLELLLRGYVGEIDDKQRHYLGLALDSCTRLHSVVNDLLDVAKYESGHLEVELGEVDIAALLHEATEQYHGAALERGLTVSCNAPGRALVAGDRTRLFQVLNNILSNALKFVRKGGKIELGLLTSDVLTDHVGFTVWNSGPAVSDDDLESMFEKFRQLPGARRRIGGTGLGLPIARALIESHSGRLWAKRGVKEGVRFVAVLPRLVTGRAPALDEAVVRDLEAVRNRIEGAVVVADPDAMTGVLIKGALQRYGLTVLTAPTVDDTLALLRTRPISVLVVDPRMGGDGGGLLLRLAGDPAAGGLPVVVTAPTAAGVGSAPHAAQRPFASADLVYAIAMALFAKGHGRQARAIVVDPDPQACEVAASALVSDGYEVACFSDAPSALSAAYLRAPDLAVIDAALGGAVEAGLALARALAITTKGTPGTLLLAADAAHAARLRQGSSFEVLMKPFDAASLAERARAAMARLATITRSA